LGEACDGEYASELDKVAAPILERSPDGTGFGFYLTDFAGSFG